MASGSPSSITQRIESPLISVLTLDGRVPERRCQIEPTLRSISAVTDGLDASSLTADDVDFGSLISIHIPFSSR